MTDKTISDEKIVEALKAAKGAVSGPSENPKVGRKLSDEEKARREQEKADRKAKRDAERIERQAKKAQKPAAHMAKVNKAAAKLPALSDTAQTLLNDVFAALDAAAIASFIENLTHRLRVEATIASSEVKLEAGQMVRIVAGEHARFIGSLATVVDARRIRVIVETAADDEGKTRKLYLFNTDVVPVAQTLSSESLEITEETVAEAV